ncbi:hypothetical protein BJ878DRAFT_423290 [Calycina marina]|uniref:GS catalytic domain-containing protein n=1 Tax=Calycina marina TaxID=1763456 RepID=A0A9P7Z1C6_9HELO|nr:hypothetical protein BJ878DRAFT_423290 [Calycina marina]
MGEMSVSGTNPSALALQQFLESNESIRFFRLQWVTYLGVVMMRVITKQYALSLARNENTLSLSSPILTVLLLAGGIMFDDTKCGSELLWPDWLTLKVCHYQTGNSSFMCCVEEAGTEEDKSFRRCPRSRLQELEMMAKSKHDLEFLMGFEVEFQLTKPATVSTPAQQARTSMHVYAAAALRSSCLPVLEEIVDALVNSGIQIRQFHAEGDHGLFESTALHCRRRSAVDTLVYTHETIKTIMLSSTDCRSEKTRFSQTTGAHIHLSMSRTEREDAFFACILKEYAALAGFYLPNYDSYPRVKENQWIAWGTRNKTCPIKKLSPGYWEFRHPDATMNPYLATLAIITAGLVDIETNTPLTLRIHEGLDDQQVADHGITDKIPRSLKESLALFKKSTSLNEALGPEIVEKYLMHKSREEESFKQMTANERKVISMGLF